MSLFSFITDNKAEQYCRDIIDLLVSSYSLSPRKALRCLNCGWRGMDFVGMDLRYHKGGPEDWAKHIYHEWYLKGH